MMESFIQSSPRAKHRTWGSVAENRAMREPATSHGQSPSARPALRQDGVEAHLAFTGLMSSFPLWTLQKQPRMYVRRYGNERPL